MAKKKDKINLPPLNQGKSFFPHFKDSFNSDLSKPYFSFKYLSKTYCITCCDKDEKASFAMTMYNLSQMTWLEIRKAHKHGLGTEKIEKDAIKVAVPKDITDDVTFLAIRFHGKKPMVGFRQNATFYVIWFDRDFTLYDHG